MKPSYGKINTKTLRKGKRRKQMPFDFVGSHEHTLTSSQTSKSN